MGAWIVDNRAPRRSENGDGGADEDERGRDEDRDRRHLHLEGLDLFPQVFGRAADHEPGDEHGHDGEHQHSIKPRANAAEHHLSQLHHPHRDEAADRREGIVHRIHGAVRGGGRGGRPEGGGGDTEARFLAFHVAAALERPRRAVDAEQGVTGRGRPLAKPTNDERHNEQRHHDGEDRPTLARVFHHLSEGEAERSGDPKDRESLEKVGKRRRILIGVGGVDVEEAAAIGPELFDGDLGCGGTERQHLALRSVARVEDGHRLGRAKGLHRPLPHQHQRKHECERKEDVESRPREVGPEVPDRGAPPAGEAARERREDRHPRRRRDEVLNPQSQHLRQIGEGCLAAVALPVGIRGKAERGVEREVGGHRADSLRVERQRALRPLQAVDRERPQGIESEHRERVAAPGHLLVGANPTQTIDQPLQRPEHPVEEDRLPLQDARHVAAEGLHQQ